MSLSIKLYLSTRGAAVPAGEFVLEGGLVTIGRSKTCTMQLPDPQRLLSRVHVELRSVSGGCRLRVASERSSVLINGRVYPPGSEVSVRVGDRLAMDVHEIVFAGFGRPPAPPEMPGAQPHVAPPGLPAGREETPDHRVGRAGRAKPFWIAGAIVVVALAVLMFIPWPGTGAEDLSYSGRSGGRLYFKGRHKGESFQLVASRPKGGPFALTIYTGAAPDRIKAIYSGPQGPTEYLSLRTGHRVTLVAPEGRHVEYRLYQPDGRYGAGFVVYRDNSRWLKGVLKTEAFEGYGALVDVTDVTRFALQPVSATRPIEHAPPFLRGLQVIAPANAADGESDDLANEFERFVRQTQTDAGKHFWEIVGKSLKVMTIGVAQTVAGSNSQANGSGILYRIVERALSGAMVLTLADRALALHREDPEKQADPLPQGELEGYTRPSRFESVVEGLSNLFARSRAPASQTDTAPAESIASSGRIPEAANSPSAAPVATPPGESSSHRAFETPNDRKGYWDGVASRVKVEEATTKAESCIHSGNFDCAEKAIAEAKSHATRENYYDQIYDAEIIDKLAESLARARKRVETEARDKEEALRMAARPVASPPPAPARKPLGASTTAASVSATPAPQSSCGTRGAVILVKLNAASSADIPLQCRSGREDNWAAAQAGSGMSTQAVCNVAIVPTNDITGKPIEFRNMTGCFCVENARSGSGVATKCWVFYERA